EDGIRDRNVTGVQTCALPIYAKAKKGGAHADLSAYSALLDEGASEFVGYDRLESDSRIRGIVSDGVATEVLTTGQSADVVLDLTPFYAESGGQRDRKSVV